MQIIKRDGRITEFNEERIIKAITLAMSNTLGGVDIDLATKIADSVRNQVKDKVQVSVYEIQDLVEKKLMGSSRKEVAQAYITYRYRYDMPSAFVNAGGKDDVSKEKYESKGASAGGDGDQSMAGAEFSF